MGTMKDLILDIERKRDINCVRLSYRVYNRLSDKSQTDFWIEFKETPEYGPIGHDGRIRPLRWLVADMALFLYARNKKQISLHKAFRIARKYREKLWNQFNEVCRETSSYEVSKHRLKCIAQQFLFYGFVPLSEFKDVDETPKDFRGNSYCPAYITSSQTIEGVTYIYPKKLYMSSRPGQKPDKRFLWYQFEGGGKIPGYTRTWYTNEIKNLKRAQNAQRSNS